MSRAVPTFLPMLTSYVVRVSGRPLDALLTSSGGLARALTDAQKVIGHDGVLCLPHVPPLIDSCLDHASGRLRAAEEVPRSGAMDVILGAVRALRRQLPLGVAAFASFAGPALLLSELTSRVKSGEPVDDEYAGDVFLSAIRAAFEAEAHGVAILEARLSKLTAAVAGAYRAARKLADFYDGSLFVFYLPGPERAAATDAHGVFLLDAERDPSELVRGVGPAGLTMPATTAADVPADTAIEHLRELSVRMRACTGRVSEP